MLISFGRQLEFHRFALAAILVLSSCYSASAQNDRLLGTARTVLVQSDVVYNKNRAFRSNAVPYSTIVRSGLLRSFQGVTTHPDIIVKIHKDVFIIDEEKISLTVFDADDNSVLYAEERKLIDEDNDVDRLMAHFLARVKEIREIAASERAAEIEKEKSRAREERDAKALQDAEAIVSIFSTSGEVLQAVIEESRTKPNQYHIYLKDVSRRDAADVILEETVSKGNYVLKLISRDDNELLHTVVLPEKFSARAAGLMARWITSTTWE